MKSARWAVLLVLALATAAGATEHRAFYVGTRAGGPWLPDPRVTPGQVRDLTKAQICATRWGEDPRRVSDAMKREAYRRYGAVKRAGVCCQVDHLIPRSLGGADHLDNLWPVPWAQVRLKDRLALWLHREVCAGRLALGRAQHAMARNWVQAYDDMLRRRGLEP